MKAAVKRLPLRALRYADSALQRARFGSLLVSHRLGGFSSAPFPVARQVRSSSPNGKGRHSFEKLDRIVRHMPAGARTVVDIGSNNGFFAIHLALADYDVLGYEPVQEFVAGANQVCERYQIPNAAFIARGIDLESSAGLFDADVTLVLSVFHNWVKQFDFETALRILQNIWSRTKQAMFFELADTLDNTYIAGFSTMPSMGSSTEECGIFMAERILGPLANGTVQSLGMMPTDYRNGAARHFFVVQRKA